MSNLLLADFVVLIHFGFILFVIFGGVLIFLDKRFLYLHIPALLWGIAIMLFGWLCPLTTLENKLRSASGYGAYSSGFIDHYIIPIIYPEGLTREIQIILGIALVVFNGLVYWLLFLKWKKQAD